MLPDLFTYFLNGLFNLVLGFLPINFAWHCILFRGNYIKKLYLLLLSSFVYFSHCSSQRRTSELIWLPLQKLISISSIRLSFTPHPAVHASLSLTRNLDHRLGFCKRGFTSFSSSPRGKQVLLFGEMRAQWARCGNCWECFVSQTVILDIFQCTY